MNNKGKKLKVYLASGWFTPVTKDILDHLEARLTSMEDVDLYSPRRDGVMLPPDQRHDTELRERVFRDNIQHILDADLVLANIHSTDDHNDTGTIYEIGFATANNIPVVGFALSEENVADRFKGIMRGFECNLWSYHDLDMFFKLYRIAEDHNTNNKQKVLFVGNGDEAVDKQLASYIMDSGASLRWVNEVHSEVYSRIDEIFKDIDYMIAVIDDRKTLVSWMIGQAYARGIPVITYSNHNYMINIMLLVSVRYHLRGIDQLQNFLQAVKREGLESIPQLDISEFNAC